MSTTPLKATRAPCLISAPYAAGEGRSVAVNAERAMTLARHAFDAGYLPICIHPLILWGVLGDDNDPASREVGIEAACDYVRLVAANPTGCLWVLQNDDGSMSEGVTREVIAYQDARRALGLPDIIEYGGWSKWLLRLQEEK